MSLTTAVFVVAVGFLMVHELDAIREAEWRFFFPMLDDVTGYWLFTAAHVPLFGLILWFWPVPGFQVGLDVFMMVHLGLHVALRNHPKIQFKTWFSWVWIVGAAVLGAVHLAFVLLA